ncbi:hypothetical protein ABTE09_20270, partial [Acinetobacter baumannii]
VASADNIPATVCGLILTIAAAAVVSYTEQALLKEVVIALTEIVSLTLLNEMVGVFIKLSIQLLAFVLYCHL